MLTFFGVASRLPLAARARGFQDSPLRDDSARWREWRPFESLLFVSLWQTLVRNVNHNDTKNTEISEQAL